MQTLIAVVRMKFFSREAYSSVLSARPDDDSNPRFIGRTYQMQKVAEKAMTLYERASSASSENTRKMRTDKLIRLSDRLERLTNQTKC